MMYVLHMASVHRPPFPMLWSQRGGLLDSFHFSLCPPYPYPCPFPLPFLE
jgi:hypothetical protein